MYKVAKLLSRKLLISATRDEIGMIKENLSFKENHNSGAPVFKEVVVLYYVGTGFKYRYYFNVLQLGPAESIIAIITILIYKILSLLTE